MQTLNALFKQMETRLRELESELQKIKKQVALITEENNALRQTLARVYGQGEVDDKSKTDPHPQGAFGNLKHLYEQGFHVCNVHFGQLRKEECLFCFSLLERGKGRAGT